jgi:hypothetical protein
MKQNKQFHCHLLTYVLTPKSGTKPIRLGATGQTGAIYRVRVLTKKASTVCNVIWDDWYNVWATLLNICRNYFINHLHMLIFISLALFSSHIVLPSSFF